MGSIARVVRSLMLSWVCLGYVAACSTTVPGSPQAQAPRDADAPTVASSDLARLLLSDQQVSDIVGVTGMVKSDVYSDIPGPQGESYSEPRCAEALYNTMWTSYDGSGYSGAAGQRVREPGDDSYNNVDEGVVSFPDAAAATRFVVRTSLEFDSCADVHFSDTSAPTDSETYFWTIGFPQNVGDTVTVVSTEEGQERYGCAKAITSRSNVVIDVYWCAQGAAAKTPADLVNAIANNMPH